MQIVVATQINKAYMLGGGVDENYNTLSNQVLEWNILTDEI